MKSTMPWNLVAVVPAHNEADRVGACVRSLLHAVDYASGRIARCCLVVVADKCTDATAEIARQAIAETAKGRSNRASGPIASAHVIEIDSGNVGTARALGVATAQRRLGPVDPARTWIANTDADTCVPSSWITEQLRWADDGIAAVAGVVTVDSFGEHPPIVAERFHARYTALLPDESLDHPHVHGANLGVRLDAYLNAGGWHRLDLSEDHDLWNRLRADDLVIRSPSSLRVTTSGRAVSRCPGGFADGLCADRMIEEVTA